MNTEQLVKNFFSPPAEFRGAPFWAWNSKLEPERLRAQISTMKKMGMGGFFMHSRVGLKTPYLSREWFDCAAACIDQAKKEDLSAWLYDEDRWPSGAAGGIVTADERFKMKELLVEWDKEGACLTDQGTTLACFAAVFEDEKVTSYRRIGKGEELAENETLVRCYYAVSKNSPEFNGQTYLDTMNEEAVRKFIDVTHEAYKKEFGAEFGKTVPGIFTDEPCYSLPYRSVNNLPWTEGFEEKFREKFHYDLCDGMIELFFECGKEFSPYRNHFYLLAAELFVNAFGKQTGQWCRDNDFLLTGHVLGEDDLEWSSFCAGNPMWFYEQMQIPGIDLLTERWTTYATVKQLASVARQFGKKRRLSELYGCTGWDFPLFGHKSLGDWQYALGINFRCHHLCWYSMDAEAKRDFPATISEHSPYHPIYSVVEDHFARAGSVISSGDEVRDILVIHPIESAWGVRYRVTPDISPGVARLNEAFFDLANTLLGANLDFDYGDEAQIARCGKVDGKNFIVGQAAYKAIVVPALKTIRSSTLELLKTFVNSGGTVFSLGPAPEYVDAVRSDEGIKTFSLFINTDTPGLAVLMGKRFRRVSLADEKGREIAPLLFHLSRTEGDQTLFICNTGIGMSDQPMARPMVRERKLNFPYVRAAVAGEPGKTLYEFNTLKGEIYNIPFVFEEDKYIFETSFDELESRLFVLAAEKITAALPPPPRLEAEKRVYPECAENPVFRDEPNVLILDRADVTVDGKEVLQDEFILSADVFLRKQLGKEPRSGEMTQPYLADDTPPEKTLELELKYTFEVRELPEKACMLAVEHPELYRITLNGRGLEQHDCGHWIDPVLRQLKIPADRIRKGKNLLILKGTYHEKLPGLESLFLLGEFGVFQNTIGKLPVTLSWGDWCEHGFPAYGGNLTYRMPLKAEKGKRAFLCIPEWRGSALGIKINEAQEEILISPPFKADVTQHLRYDGRDTADICVYGHRRNVFGPFYAREKWVPWTGPEQFKICETSERQTVPCGVLSKPYIEIIKEKK